MDQEACFGFEDDGIEDVDLSAIPTSAEDYFRQMRAERRKQPAVVAITSKTEVDCTSPEAKRQRQWCETNGVVKTEKMPETRRSLIPSEEWQRRKCQQFGEFRERMALKSAEPQMKIKALHTKEPDDWHQILLEKCLPEFENQLENFPNHTGTPPVLQMVLALPRNFHTNLIEFVADWAEEEGFTRPIREWFYSILLIVASPLTPEAVSAVRMIAKQCRNLRAQLTEDRKSEALEYSLFIAIIGIFFVQKDISDLV